MPNSQRSTTTTVCDWLDWVRTRFDGAPASDQYDNGGGSGEDRVWWRAPIPEKPTGYPRLAPMCRWCMERTISGAQFYTLHHPHFAYLCGHCREEIRMFIQRLCLHHAMTQLQATEAVMELLDLPYDRKP